VLYKALLMMLGESSVARSGRPHNPRTGRRRFLPRRLYATLAGICVSEQNPSDRGQETK
jgi:hypothetical protein